MRQTDSFQPLPASARGLIRRHESARHFQLLHREPAAELAHLVAHYWQVSWDLRGRSDYVQQNLSHPSVHLSLESGGFCGVRGVHRRSFHYRLSGRGRVLGVKFHPAAFCAFSPAPAHSLADRRIALGALWGEDETLWRSHVTGPAPAEVIIGELEALLGRRADVLPPAASQVRQWVEAIARQPELCTPEALARHDGVSVRSLQRLFRRYLGVSPKWVIDRYRMIEAVEAINAGGRVELADLACRLGYFDQAHFTRAFRALVGMPPSRV